MMIAMLAALGASGPAAAARYVATYTGTITSGVDREGIVLAPDATLAGTAYQAVFTFDPDLARLSPREGYFWQGNAAFETVTFTANGRSFSFNSNAMGYAARTDASYRTDGRDLIGNFVANTNASYIQLGVSTLWDIVSPGDFTSSFSYVTRPGDTYMGSVVSLGDGFQRVYGELSVSSVTVAPFVAASPAPEPATWAMMVAGFGLAGAAMRRRRAVPVLAAIR